MTPMKQTPATFVVFALAAFCGCRGSKDIVWSFATPWPWVLAGDSQALTPAIDGNAVFFLRWLRRKEAIAPKWQHNVGSCTSAPLISAETVIGFAFAGQSDRIVVCGLDRIRGVKNGRSSCPAIRIPPRRPRSAISFSSRRFREASCASIRAMGLCRPSTLMPT